MDDTKRDHKDKAWNVADPQLKGALDQVHASILMDIRDQLFMRWRHGFEDDDGDKPAKAAARPRIPKRKR